MDGTFYDGYDELCHRAKFGEDRTTRAGCRCENVVFVFFVCFYRQDCRAAANCRYCFYSQAKNQVFRPAGATRSTDSDENFAGPTGTGVRLAVQNFT